MMRISSFLIFNITLFSVFRRSSFVEGENLRKRNIILVDDHSPRVVKSFTGDINRRSDPDNDPQFESDEADFYYPVTNNEGTSTFDENVFPLVVFLQGALADKEHFSDFATELASLGYVVVVPNHLQILFQGDPMFFASQWTINDVIADAKERVEDPESPLYMIVDTGKVGVSGHSFGAAAGLFAVAEACQFPFCGLPPPLNSKPYELPSEVGAAAAVSTHFVPTQSNAPCLCEPQSSVSYPPHARPVSIVTGSLDDPDCTSISYDAISGVEDKSLILLDGVNHWGVANFQTPPGNTPDCRPQTKPQGWSIAKFAKWVGVVFDVYLKNDNGARKKLEGSLSEQGVHVIFN